MGYFFTLLYLLTAYVTPTILFGSLAEFHVEVLVVLLAVLFSIPSFSGSGLVRSSQMLAFAGMAFTIIVSFLKIGWLGGAFEAFYGFMQPCFAFFLVAINCRTKRHLQGIILVMFLGSLFFIGAGLLDLHNDVVPSEYIFGETGVRRIRGLGFVHDPNDLAQMLVSLIPAVFLWRQKSFVANLPLVALPIALLLTGTFFTHSRGGALALAAVILVSARRKIGTVPAAMITGVMLAGTLALGWSGGRDVSMEGGADRLDLWYSGLELIKSSPLFGVGLGGYTERVGITAHNSIIICAAETGMVGLFFWVLLIFSTIRDGVLFGKTEKRPAEEALVPLSSWLESPAKQWTSAAVPALAGEMRVAMPLRGEIKGFTKVVDRANSLPFSDFSVEDQTLDDIYSMAKVLIASLTGFLVAGWFLSRPYGISLFMYCGMMFAVLRMGAEKSIKPKKDSLAFLLSWTACITCSLIVLISLMLRLRNF